MALAKMRAVVVEVHTKGRTGQRLFRFGFLDGQLVRSQRVDAQGKIGTSNMFEPHPQTGVLASFMRLQDALLELT